MRFRRISLFAFLITALITATLQFCHSPSENQSENSPYINHRDSVEYVGMAVCASCHADKHETFVHTGMGQSFDWASMRKSSADFNAQHLLYDSFLNFYYHPFWKGDKLFVKEFRIENGDTVYQRNEEITYIIGSGQHTNSHLIKKGDFVVQAPFTWYAQRSKLDFPPGFENGNNSRFSRIIDEECMSCHNSMPVMKSSSRTFSKIGTGIDCERCHGPGSAHVAFRSSGKIPDGDIDYTIVNPAKLSWKRQMDVCQRCHLQGDNVLKPGKSFTDFRPGMELASVFEVFLPAYSDSDDARFNMANHADRLQSSKCFIATNGSNLESTTFTCITCHNPHVSVKTLKSSHFNNVCQNCHKSGKSMCSAPMEKRNLLSDNCVKCHMPVSGTEDIPHVLVHDHKIAVYSDTVHAQPKHSEVTGLYCVNKTDPEPDMLIRAYLTYYEKFDPLPVYQQKAEALLKEHPDPELLIHLRYQQQNWKAIILISTKEKDRQFDGMTCYRIGKAHHMLNSFTGAKQWLELAVLKEKERFEFQNELAATLIKLEDYANALVHLKECLDLFPEYVPALNNAGFCHIMNFEPTPALVFLKKSLSLDPDNITALENLALLYDRMNQTEKLKQTLERILKIDQNHDAARKRLLTIKSG